MFVPTHGNHWQCIASGENELMRFMESTLARGVTLGRFTWEGINVETGRKQVNKLDAMAYPDANLRFLFVTVNGSVWTGYPYAVSGIRHSVDVVGMFDWGNGIEANVAVRSSRAQLHFFDTLYFRRRAHYPPKRHTFVISALAYRLFRGAPMKKVAPGAAILTPIQGAGLDDYAFRVPVREASAFDLEGHRVYQLGVILFVEDGQPFDTFLYASDTAVQPGYVPRVGDDISGTLWLQGYEE